MLQAQVGLSCYIMHLDFHMGALGHSVGGISMEILGSGNNTPLSPGAANPLRIR